MKIPNVLYHGSPNKLRGDMLNPSWGDDSEERPENNIRGVYATDRKDLAMVMAMVRCKDVIGGSIEGYKKGKLDARLYGNYPKQEFIYLYYLSSKGFKITRIDKHQFVSKVAVKPIKVEKIKVSDYYHLARVATKAETSKWINKYEK